MIRIPDYLAATLVREYNAGREQFPDLPRYAALDTYVIERLKDAVYGLNGLGIRESRFQLPEVGRRAGERISERDAQIVGGEMTIDLDIIQERRHFHPQKCIDTLLAEVERLRPIESAARAYRDAELAYVEREPADAGSTLPGTLWRARLDTLAALFTALESK